MERRGFLKACGAAVLACFIRLTPELAPEPARDSAVWYELRDVVRKYDHEQDLSLVRFTYHTSDPRGTFAVLLIDKGNPDVMHRLGEIEVREALGLVA